MEFSTDGESLPSSQKPRHSAIHVTRSDGVFACCSSCSTSCSNSCSCRRCCLLLDSAAAAESENNNKERGEGGEGMEEEQQTEPEPLEDEQDCCVFKQHCQQVLPGGEVTTNRAHLNSVSSSFYMDSNISEGESDMEDIQVRKQKQPHALHYSVIPWFEITKTRCELLLVKSCSVVRINNISDFN